MCLACQHFDFNSADCDHQLIFANNEKGIYLSVQETFVGQERVTNPKNHREPTQSVCVADCYFIVNVLDLPFASPIAIYR